MARLIDIERVLRKLFVTLAPNSLRVCVPEFDVMAPNYAEHVPFVQTLGR